MEFLIVTFSDILRLCDYVMTEQLLVVDETGGTRRKSPKERGRVDEDVMCHVIFACSMFSVVRHV